jgi:hypothetical protein
MRGVVIVILILIKYWGIGEMGEWGNTVDLIVNCQLLIINC